MRTILSNLRRLFKQLKCDHSHAWDFYPDVSWYKNQMMKGNIKITYCWKCGSIIKVENYGQ